MTVWNTGSSWTQTSTAVTTTASLVVPDDDDYHWRVRANDGQAFGNWSSTNGLEVFSIAETGPSQVSLSLPDGHVPTNTCVTMFSTAPGLTSRTPSELSPIDRHAEALYADVRLDLLVANSASPTPTTRSQLPQPASAAGRDVPCHWTGPGCAQLAKPGSCGERFHGDPASSGRIPVRQRADRHQLRQHRAAVPAQPGADTGHQLRSCGRSDRHQPQQCQPDRDRSGCHSGHRTQRRHLPGCQRHGDVLRRALLATLC